jgi:hypothetical protein
MKGDVTKFILSKNGKSLFQTYSSVSEKYVLIRAIINHVVMFYIVFYLPA